MGVGIIKDANIFLGSYDLTSVHSEITLNASNDILDATTFPDLTRTHLPGLKDTEVSGTGFLPFGDALGTSGSFDTAADLADWTASGDCSIALDSGSPQAGANCCEITATGAGIKHVSATISLKANRSYRATFYFKDGTASGETVRWYLASTGITTPTYTTAAGWVQGEVNFTVSEDGDYIGRILWEGATAANTLFVDSFEIYEVIDKALYNNMSTSGSVCTICPNASTIGSLAYFFKSTQSEYTPGGAIGELLGFSWAAGANDRLSRGNVLESARVASTDTSIEQGNGVVLTDQNLYAALHVLSVSGTTSTLDVIIQSDATGFAGPNNRITFTQATGITSEYATPVAGPITDDFWRVSYTVGGANEEFVFIVVMAIM